MAPRKSRRVSDSTHPGEATSELIQKGLPCENPNCNSHDAVAIYDDGHRYCFSCGTFFPPTEGDTPRATTQDPPKARVSMDLTQVITSGKHVALRERKLTQATCKFWDYRVRQSPSGHYEEIATYRDAHGTPVGAKIRDTGTPEEPLKEFAWVGSAHGQLFGRHLWGSGGRMLTIVEGEIDTMSVSQCNDHKYAVVGIPNGAHEAVKAVAANIEWINTFDKVILGFDMDQQGRDACLACAEVLPPGKAFIASWGDLKDPNELLKADRARDITGAIWNAKPYRPDGIVDARELTAACLGDPETGIPWPWPDPTGWTYGRRLAELIVVGAGFGIGKTDWLAEVIAADLQGTTKYGVSYEPQAWGVFSYEAGAATVKKQIAGKLAHRRFHIPQDESGASWTREELEQTMTRMDGPLWEGGGKLFINDSKGAADWETVQNRIRFLRHSEGVRNFAIDPLSAMVEEEEGSGDNERKILDNIVRSAAKLCVELDVRVIIFSHLTRPSDGPPHEEGGQVRGKQFRGSNAIGMFANFVFGLERNTQAENEADRCITTIRVIKDRFTGNSAGKTTKLVYDVLCGTLDLPDPLFGAVGDTDYKDPGDE